MRTAAPDEVPHGQIGHVALQGPQTFAGYVNDPEETARTISTDGYLYTGDMGQDQPACTSPAAPSGSLSPPATRRSLGMSRSPARFRKRWRPAAWSAWSIPSGWRPSLPSSRTFRRGAHWSQLRRHARSLTSYMRPLHYVIVEPGQLPLNRVAKVDSLRSKQMADDEVRELRARGRWRDDREED